MAVWLVRAGSAGEFEDKFISERRVYVTWDGLNVDLSTLKNREQVQAELWVRYPESKPKTLQNWSSQIWPFAQRLIVIANGIARSRKLFVSRVGTF